jgi:hypothetical protein
MTAHELLPSLKGVKKSGSGWTAKCPAHADKKPSLSITESSGKLLLTCHAGCSFESIIAAIPHVNGNGARHEVAHYDYRDANGDLLFQAVRFEPKDFRQRRPGDDGSWVWDLKNTSRVLYRLPELLAADATETIFVVEGEKDADRLCRSGLTATCNPCGALKWRKEYNQPLRGRHVAILADNDEPGRKHAGQVATSLQGVAASIKVVNLPGLSVGGDVSDWLQTNDVDALTELVKAASLFQNDNNHRISVKTFTCPELMALDLPEPRAIIPGILLEGTSTVLNGPPKARKTFLMLQSVIAIASGGRVLGKIEVEQRDALYLCLEDGPRRLQKRLLTMLAGCPAPERLTLATDWPTSGEGGLEEIERWIGKQKNPGVVVIDTLKRFRSPEIGASGKRLYDMDYDSVAGITDLSHKTGVAFVQIHHTRKMYSPDHVEMVSGSHGVTGACDGILSLRGARGECDAVLCVTSRDMPDAELALGWDGQLLQWNLLGDASEINKSKARREVTELLRKAEKPLSPREVADLLGKEYPATKKLLWIMSKAGEVKASNGKYSLPVSAKSDENPATNELVIPGDDESLQRYLESLSQDDDEIILAEAEAIRLEAMGV